MLNMLTGRLLLGQKWVSEINGSSHWFRLSIRLRVNCLMWVMNINRAQIEPVMMNVIVNWNELSNMKLMMWLWRWKKITWNDEWLRRDDGLSGRDRKFPRPNNTPYYYWSAALKLWLFTCLLVCWTTNCAHWFDVDQCDVSICLFRLQDSIEFHWLIQD